MYKTLKKDFFSIVFSNFRKRLIFEYKKEKIIIKKNNKKRYKIIYAYHMYQ